MRDQHVFVSRRKQRAQKNEIGHAPGDLIDGLHRGVDHDELGAYALGKNEAQDISLHLVRLQYEDSAQHQLLSISMNSTTATTRNENRKGLSAA